MTSRFRVNQDMRLRSSAGGNYGMPNNADPYAGQNGSYANPNNGSYANSNGSYASNGTYAQNGSYAQNGNYPQNGNYAQNGNYGRGREVVQSGTEVKVRTDDAINASAGDVGHDYPGTVSQDVLDS